MSKYDQWYAAITENAKTRNLSGYTEKHHIMPTSVGGADIAANKVKLTAREHFICHWLLTKIYVSGKEHYKMLAALRGMRRENKNQQRYKTKITSRVYENLKSEWAIAHGQLMLGDANKMRGTKLTDEQKEFIRVTNTGRIQPPEEKANQKQAQTGRKRAPFSEEWRENLGKNHKSKNPDYDCSLKEETKKKIGDKIRGRKQTDEEKKKRGDSVKALKLKREKLLCPYCNREVAVNGYARWHGENCKHNPVNNNRKI